MCVRAPRPATISPAVQSLPTIFNIKTKLTPSDIPPDLPAIYQHRTDLAHQHRCPLTCRGSS